MRSTSPQICTALNCGKQFSSVRGLKGHMVVHNGESKTSCSSQEICLTFQKESPAHSHLKPEEKVFACTFPGCKRTFDKKVKLAKHKRKDHKEEQSSGLSKIKVIDAVSPADGNKALEHLNAFQLPDFFNTRFLPMPIQVATNADSVARLAARLQYEPIRINDIYEPLPGTYSSSLWLSEDAEP